MTARPWRLAGRILRGVPPHSPLTGQPPHAHPEFDLGHVPICLIGLGAATGAALALAYGLAWRLYGDLATLRIIPAALTLAGLMLLLFPRAWSALVRLDALLHRPPRNARRARMHASNPAHGSTSGATPTILTLLLFAALLAIPVPLYQQRSDADGLLARLQPPVPFDALALAPMWFVAGIMMAATLGRPARQADRLTAAFCLYVRARHASLAAALPAGLCAWWLSPGIAAPYGISTACLSLTLSFLTAAWLVRPARGHTTHTLQACGFLTMLYYLLIYLATASELIRMR